MSTFLSFQCLCLSVNTWSSIVDTRSVPSLLVPSPLDGPECCMLRQVGLHICWKLRQRVIRKIAANQF